MSKKVDVFFDLLRAAYGADVIDRKWPTELDKQLVKKLKEEAIERLDFEEIKGAIQNACDQKSKGNEEFMFLDIDMIIAGAKRYGSPSHRLLPPPVEHSESKKKAMRENGKHHIQNLKNLFN